MMPQLEPHYDAIIADLPYDVTEMEWDNIIPIDKLWSNYSQLKKSNGPIILFGNEPFTSFLVLSKVDWFRHKWTWEKDKAANFLNAPYMPISTCEDILVFNQFGYAISVQNKPTYNPQMTKSDTYKAPNKSKSIDEFSLRQITKRKNPTPLESNSNYNGWERYPKSRIYFPVDYGRERFHPTQKPVALLQYLIRTYTNQGDIILDNTAGSGTTGAAAQNEGRRCVMIEKSEEYCRIAADRLRQPSFFSLPSMNGNGSGPKKAEQLELMA